MSDAPLPPPPPPGGGAARPHPDPGPTPSTPPAGPPPPAAPTPAGTDDEVLDLDDRPRPLDPRVVPLWRLSTALSTLLPGGVAVTFLGGFLGRTAALSGAAALLVLTVVLTIWYPPAKYRRWRWRLTDLALELHHGVWVHRTETLPYFRIQQIDVNQGPIDRLLDLATLEVTSASASGSVSLPGIPEEDAPAVRRTLLERASAAAAGDDGDGVRDAV